jgi:hypothetical protein
MSAPRVYLRVGPSGSGHTSFIQNLAQTRDLKLFTKRTRTPRKMFHHGSTKFEHTIYRYEGKKMVAFDNFRANHMCCPRQFKFLTCRDIDTWVFSVNDKGMESCGEVDADDVLAHAFIEDLRAGVGLVARRINMYQYITDIHHMLPDGTVRILACDGKKLDEAIVLTADACMARETARVDIL